jgi:RNA polymerase sigma-70 factor (ECF subfamily)
MLTNLSPQIREAFLLSQLEGFTYQQIASKLGVCERTVKNYMSQAMLQCLKIKNRVVD